MLSIIKCTNVLKSVTNKVCNNPLIYRHQIKILLLNEKKQKQSDRDDWVP